MNSLTEFMNFTESIGLGMNSPPIDDGSLHRFTVTNDKPASNNGWYVLYGDGFPNGIVGSWKTGETHKWSGKPDHPLTKSERRVLKKRQQKAVLSRKIEKAQRSEKAANKCNEIWQASTPANNHPYLMTKGIQTHGVREYKGSLVIPVRNSTGVITSLQYIQVNGDKRFHPHGLIKGGYCSIGSPHKRLFICEGFATGSTIFEHTGDGVAVAFNAGNLKTAAQTLRHKYPDLSIVIAADNDHEKLINVGISKALEAAQSINGMIVYPPSIEGVSDFNDLAKLKNSIEVLT